MLRKILLIIFVFALLFTRFYNLSATTRFDHDDARNLRDIHRIWVTKDITLIGPINGAKNIIYPSLTFYMLLPFSYWGNFEPDSLALGAAFYGVATAILLVYLVSLVNKKFIFWASILTLLWFPLVDSSRIAWNPHLVPFIQILALIFFLKSENNRKLLLVSGFLFGLTFHLHYFSIVSTATFLVILFVKGFVTEKSRKLQNLKNNLLLLISFAAAFIPFVIFDLLKPPGLFFGRFLHENIVGSGGGNMSVFLITTINNFKLLFNHLSGGNLIIFLFLVFSFSYLVINDARKRKVNLVYFLPVFTQIVAISFLPEYFNRYFYLSIGFFVVWLFSKREKSQENVVKLTVILMLAASLGSVRDYLTKPVREPSALTVRFINNYIASRVHSDNLKNVNITVLQSPDPDPFGVIYRESLLVKDVTFLPENQYDITDNLFVVTTGDEDQVRKDPANLINGFRDGVVDDKYSLRNSKWRVLLIKRHENF
ncbi:MAG TPA: hypothetical protein VI819_03000 [Patescibacteria group bacterium]|nr:hypothetical protein [Patescibacteria group bacterium]